MKDFRGKEVMVGDAVIIANHSDRNHYLTETVITKITPKGVKTAAHHSMVKPQQMVLLKKELFEDV